MTAAESIALVLGLALLWWRGRTPESSKPWKDLLTCAVLAAFVVFDGTQALVGFSHFAVAFFLSSALVKDQRRRGMLAAGLVGLLVLVEPTKLGRWEWIAVVYLLALTLPQLRSFVARHQTASST